MSAPALNPARFGPRDAQPLDGFIADAKSIVEGLFGQAKEKDLPPFAQAAIEEQERIRAIAARLFGSRDGEDLLEALCDACLRRPVFVTQIGVDPMQALAYGAFREGQAAAVYLLLAWIAEGRSEQAPNREGTSHARSTRPKRSK